MRSLRSSGSTGAPGPFAIAGKLAAVAIEEGMVIVRVSRFPS